MSNYIENITSVFKTYKQLGEKAIGQLPDAELSWQGNEDTNSVVAIIKHLWGNMLSRWTDFLTTDGEKPWRERDAEFENETISRTQLMEKWEEGWACLFSSLGNLTDADLDKTVLIRNEQLTVMGAINRQLAHYSYHVGQIVYISKLRKGKEWDSLSIPRNKTKEFNDEMFSK